MKEELDLIRVWYSRVARCVLDFDRFSHSIFFYLYLSQIGAMSLKSMQVHLIFKKSDFTVESYAHFVQLGVFCFSTILLMSVVYSLNRSISKPNYYISELAFTEYLRVCIETCLYLLY